MRRKGSRHGQWWLVLLCLGLAGLPAGLRQRLRDRVLDLRRRISQGLGRPAWPDPATRAESNRVRLLEAQLIRAQRLLEEAGAAQEVLAGVDPEVRLIPASAYPLAGATDLPQRVVLDRGSRDGVREGLPVLSGDALVGRVGRVTETSCEVHLVTDPSFRVWATILRAGGEDLEGILSGDGTWQLSLQPSVSDASSPLPTPREGETVLCSRRSALCGVPAVLGVVTAVERRPGSPVLSARVVPACDLSRLDDLVILRAPERES